MTARCAWISTLVLCTLSLLPFSGFCQGAHAATLAETLIRTSIRAPALAPSGASVAYLHSETNWKENEFVWLLWLVDVATSKSVQLTRGREAAGSEEGTTVW